MKWNAAARRVLELCDRGVAGNREMVRELTSPQLIRIDNRHGVAAPPADQDAWIRTFLDMIEVIGPEQRMTLIAQRGDRLALHHGRTKSHAGFELDFLFLVRLDEHSRFDHFENFDAQELPAAVARLDELYLQGEAAAHADILRPLSVLVAASGSRDVSGWEATLAEDSLVVDHRMSVRQEFDRDAWLETVRAQGQVAGAGVAWIPYFERLVDEGGIGPIVQRSTSPEGIEAEWVSIGMSLLDDGRITRMEILEDDGLAQAAARFDELMGDRDVSAETSGRFLENRSTRTIQRWQALWEALDWDGFEAHLSPDIEFLARHTGPKTGGELSRDALIGTMRAMVDVGYVATERERETIAIRGDRLSLHSARWTTADGLVNERLTIDEVDAERTVVKVVSLDIDDLGAAQAELDRIYLEGEGAGAPPAAFQFAWAFNARDRDRQLDLLAPGFHTVNHEDNMFPSSTSAQEFVGRMDLLVEQVPDAVMYAEEVRRFTEHALCATSLRRGVSLAGDKVEWRQILVITVDGGQMTGLEVWSDDDLEAAVRRFEELAGPANGDGSD